jgi:uncharacterized RDD family membrane protein YckC
MDRTPVQMTAAVPLLETVEMPAPAPPAPRPQLVTHAPAITNPPAATPPSGGFQANLFGPMEAPRRVGVEQPPAPPAKRAAAPRTKRDPSAQQKLEFQEVRSLNASVQASLYTKAEVAVGAHRAMAAAVDLAFTLLALGTFLATFYAAGFEIVLVKETIPYYLAAGALISLFYRALFCIGNADSPGTQWTGLQLLNFDGRRPTRGQRWIRLFGGFVSFIAAGIGLLWALVDEERLTWHDYMSKTFPTPRFE